MTNIVKLSVNEILDASDVIIEAIQDDFKETDANTGAVEALYVKHIRISGRKIAVKLYHYTTKKGDHIIFDCRLALANGTYLSYSIENPPAYEGVWDRFYDFVSEFMDKTTPNYTVH